jgi:hypothetical protein
MIASAGALAASLRELDRTMSKNVINPNRAILKVGRFTGILRSCAIKCKVPTRFCSLVGRAEGCTSATA